MARRLDWGKARARSRVREAVDEIPMPTAKLRRTRTVNVCEGGIAGRISISVVDARGERPVIALTKDEARQVYQELRDWVLGRDRDEGGA